MSLKPSLIPPVPDETARVARAGQATLEEDPVWGDVQVSPLWREHLVQLHVALLLRTMTQIVIHDAPVVFPWGDFFSRLPNRHHTSGPACVADRVGDCGQEAPPPRFCVCSCSMLSLYLYRPLILLLNHLE